VSTLLIPAIGRFHPSIDRPEEAAEPVPRPASTAFFLQITPQLAAQRL